MWYCLEINLININSAESNLISLKLNFRNRASHDSTSEQAFIVISSANELTYVRSIRQFIVESLKNKYDRTWLL